MCSPESFQSIFCCALHPLRLAVFKKLLPEKAPYQYGATINFCEFWSIFSATHIIHDYIGTEVILEDVEVIRLFHHFSVPIQKELEK